MTTPTQLYLLADHIKLSLLESQRAASLNLERNAQDDQISRSLSQMRDGLDFIQQEWQSAEKKQDSAKATELQDHLTSLQQQYDDLSSQFAAITNDSPSSPQMDSSSLTQPNNPSLQDDFAHAQDTRSRPRLPSSSSFKRSPNPSTPQMSKSVRFRDTSPPSSTPEYNDSQNRAALFPYRDDPSGSSNQTVLPVPSAQLDNQQIHAYHSDILREQDDQLDRLGESIGRQRDLSIQIGNELDDHIVMLDDVDGHMDRHQTRLDGARRQLGNVARRARDNKQLTIILILIIILVLLIIILK